MGESTELTESTLYELKAVKLQVNSDSHSLHINLAKVFSILDVSSTKSLPFCEILSTISNVYSVIRLPEDSHLIERALRSRGKSPVDRFTRREFIELMDDLIKLKNSDLHVRKLYNAKNQLLNGISAAAFLALIICVILFLLDRRAYQSLFYVIVTLACICAIGIGRILLVPIVASAIAKHRRKAKLSRELGCLVGATPPIPFSDPMVHEESPQAEPPRADLVSQDEHYESALSRYCKN